MLLFFRVEIFSICFFFRVALFSCCTFFVLHSFHLSTLSTLSIFFRAVFLQKTLGQFPLFHVLCKSCNLQIILDNLLPNSSICFFFFLTLRWSIFVLKTCCSKKRIKAPIEPSRCIVTGIEIIDDRNFQHFLIPSINFCWILVFVKAIIRVP